MSKLWSSLLEFIRILGNNSGCHQLAERSFFYKGYQFPVCARCTGVTIGQFLSLLFNIFKFKLPFKINFFMLFIMWFDWFIQYIKLKESTNLRRLITGILGGFGIVGIYFNILSFILKKINILITKK